VSPPSIGSCITASRVASQGINEDSVLSLSSSAHRQSSRRKYRTSWCNLLSVVTPSVSPGYSYSPTYNKEYNYITFIYGTLSDIPGILSHVGYMPCFYYLDSDFHPPRTRVLGIINKYSPPRIWVNDIIHSYLARLSKLVVGHSTANWKIVGSIPLEQGWAPFFQRATTIFFTGLKVAIIFLK